MRRMEGGSKERHAEGKAKVGLATQNIRTHYEIKGKLNN